MTFHVVKTNKAMAIDHLLVNLNLLHEMNWSFVQWLQLFFSVEDKELLLRQLGEDSLDVKSSCVGQGNFLSLIYKHSNFLTIDGYIPCY